MFQAQFFFLIRYLLFKLIIVFRLGFSSSFWLGFWFYCFILFLFDFRRLFLNSLLLFLYCFFYGFFCCCFSYFLLIILIRFLASSEEFQVHLGNFRAHQLEVLSAVCRRSCRRPRWRRRWWFPRRTRWSLSRGIGWGCTWRSSWLR